MLALAHDLELPPSLLEQLRPSEMVGPDVGLHAPGSGTLRRGWSRRRGAGGGVEGRAFDAGKRAQAPAAAMPDPASGFNRDLSL